MSIKFPCRECSNQYVKIVMRGLVTCHVKCTACGFVMQVEKTRVKLLERQSELEAKCEHCFLALGVSVIYHHGQKYHPHCFGKAYEEKMRKMVSDFRKDPP